MSRIVVQLKYGCLFSVIFIVFYLWNCPSISQSLGYFLLWLLGLIFFPMLISVVFSLGQFSGMIVSIFSNLFKKKSNIINEEHNNYNTSDEYINIDEYQNNSKDSTYRESSSDSYKAMYLEPNNERCGDCGSSSVIEKCRVCGKALCKSCLNDGDRCYPCLMK